jgi:hypothetical protein
VMGEEAGFSAPGVEALADILLGPWGEAMAEASVGDIIAGNLAASMVEMGEAAGAAEGPVNEFGLTIARLNQINLEGTVGDISGFFDQLPTELDAAAEAMRDTEGEIETDLTDFFARLQENLAAQAAFADNLDLLRSLGFDALADAFAAEGIESAPLLADAIANPLESAEVEAALDAAAAANAVRYLDAWRGDLTSGFDALGLQFDIPVYPILQPLNTANFALPQGIAALIGTEGSGPGGNVYEFNYYTPQTDPNDTARTEQIIRAVSNPR